MIAAIQVVALGAILYGVSPCYGELGDACTTVGNANGICSAPTKCLIDYPDVLNFDCDAGNNERGLCCPVGNIHSRINPGFRGGIKPLPRVSEANRVSSVQLPPVAQNAVQSAATSGETVISSRASLESTLRRRGIFIRSGTKESFHQAFFGNKRKAQEVARDGAVFVEASRRLSTDLNLNARQGSGLRSLSGVGTSLRCPDVPVCDANARFRTADGSCNNLENPNYGRSFQAFDRVVNPDYADGITIPRQAADGGPLPSARLVSALIATPRDKPSPFYTHFLMQFAQFVDHDLDLLAITRADNGIRIRCCGEELDSNPELRHPECFQIAIPRNDPFFSAFNEECMEFVRAAAAPRPDCKLGPREQINQLTSFIDTSMIYGSDEEETKGLRSFTDGKLRSVDVRGRELLPAQTEDVEDCDRERTDQFCFKAGDERVNEQIDLAVLHTVWLREHNRIAAELKKLNPSWDDERIFQETRRIIGAVFQHITYSEYLPLLLGYQVMQIFDIIPKREGYSNDYDPTVNPTVFNGFATAAYRYGHTLVEDTFNQVGKRQRPKKPLRVSDTFFTPFKITEDPDALDNLLRGLSSQTSQNFDSHFTKELTTLLFRERGQRFGLDLISLNIQRGRDHGLPGYNEYRRICGLTPLTSFEDLNGILENPDNVALFKRLYRNVGDIDLFIAGVSEKAYPGSILGPTFACLTGGQFAKLKKGDRFFYENQAQPNPFTPAQLAEIRKSNLARIICDNADNIKFLQPVLFLQPNGIWNSRTSCNSRRIQKLDLSAWKERGGNGGNQGGNGGNKGGTGGGYVREEDDVDEGYKNLPIWSK